MANLLSTTTVGGHSVITTDNVGTHAITSLTDTLATVTGRGATTSTRIDLGASESMRLYGIRGRFTNEYIHLYNKVGIGHPSGWGQGEGNTPNYGLSTYGGINIAYGNSANSIFNGNVGIGTSSPTTKLDVSGNIKATGTAFLPIVSDSEYINAGNSDWRTKKFVRSLGISGGDIANTWVHLSTVSISSSYHKATLKFKINGYDDVSSGNESIDVRYENGSSAQEGHNCRWYTTDNFANIFSEVRSIRSSSSGLSNTYDLYVKMAGDWRDSFTVEVEYWNRGGSISFPTTNATATTPTAGSNDIARTERDWHTNNSYVTSGSFISTGIAYAGSGYQHWGDGGTGMDFPSNDVISLKTNSTDRLYITSSGSVGIGTTSPSAKLEVNGDGTNTGGITLRHSTNQVHYIYTNSNYQLNRIGSSSPIWRWGQEGGSDRMTLNNTGLGIGTTSPAAKLNVVGTSIFSGVVRATTASWGNGSRNIISVSSDASDNNSGISFYDSSWQAHIDHAGGDLKFLTGGTSERMRITSGGNVLIGTTTDSGDRLKVSGNISSTDQISVNNRTAISVAHWSSSGSSTGAIRITLPGSHGSNWSMLVLRITAYEYNSSNHTIYYVSGHDWTSGWYQNGVIKMGDSSKDISLGYDSNNDYVILGLTSATWSYGHVTVDVVAHPSFYSSSMNIRTGWDITQTTSLSGITVQQVTNRKVLTNADEGSGNGIDADTVDGIQASSFLRSNTDDSTTGTLTIGDGSNQARLLIKKADNNAANHIEFYNGSTRVGEIGASDDTWLRINQETSRNIYTPRYIRADGGFFVDTTSKGIDGSGNFIGGTITGASDANVSNWDTAYGWGDHASEGYLTSSSLSGYATESYVNTQVSNLVDSAPGTLDTLNELAAALGDDPNFATTVTNSIAAKLPLSGGTLTGDLRFNQGAGYGRIAYIDNYHGMILRGYPNNATGSITVGDVTSLIQHSGDFRFYRTNASINELYFQVNSTAAYHRGNQIWDTSDFTSTNVSNWNTAYNWGNHASAGYLTTSGKAADSNLLDGLDSTAFQRQVDQYIVNIANPDAVSGTWTNADGDDWGTPRLGSNLARYNDGNGYVQYNIPSGMETAYISQLTWSSGGYADIQGVQADGGLVFLRRINTKQNIENSNEGSGGGNPNQHDGSTITLIGTGLSAFSAIRIQNRSGRIHLTGMSFTSAKYHGAEGTGMVHPAQISDGLNATTLDSLDSSQFLRSDTSDTMNGNLTIGGSNKIIINKSSGTFIDTGAQTDAFGYNSNYGHYIKGNVGYLYGNATYHDGTTSRTLFHTGNFTDNSSNWNTAYGWGNHASAGYLTSFDITSQTDPKYLRSDATDTKTGDTTFTGKVTLQTNLVITEDAPTISLLDTSSSDDFYIHVNSNNFYVLRNTNNSENTVDGGWDTPHPLQLEGDTNVGYLFSNRIFADNYHPNADKWTTARTLSLTGDVTGSVSWDGSANASITATIADDSHNHVISNIDGLQTALDGKLSTSAKAADSNLLDGLDSSQFLRSDTSDTVSAGRQISFYSYDNIESNTGDQASLEVFQDTSGADAFMQFHVSGDYALYFGLDGSTNDLAVGGWSMGANKYRVYHAGNLSLATLGYTGATNANYITNNNQLTNGAGYITGYTVTSSDVTTALGYTPYQESTALSATTGTFSGDITVNGNQVITSGSNADVKFSVWSGTTYGIGMTSGVTYGGLNDYAMTFCMNNDSDRGFWWGYSGQSKSSGAMSLTTSGHLTVEDKITTSKSEIDFTPTSDTIALDIRGTGTPNDYFTVSNATGGANDVFLPIFFYKAATYGYNGGTNRYTSGVYGGGFVAAVDDTSYPNAAGAGAAMHFNARTYANNGPLTSRYLFSWGSWLTTHMAMTAGGNLLIGKTSDNGEKFQVNGNAHISGNLNVDGTITGYAPSSHTHVISDITSLQSTLDGKQAQGLLDRNGLITTQDWNSFYTDDTLRVTSAHNFTAGANNAPDYSYNYGAALTYRRTSNEAFQMYFPENNGNSTNGNRRVAFRTGWNGGWSSWRRFVDMIDNVGYVTGGNDTGFEVHSDVGYNQDPGTYFLLRGQADNNQPYALKILLTGNASGNDIEWRRLKMNGADDRMYYAPEGQDQITFEYTVVTPSDARLKDNVKNISNPIEKLSKLNGCEFDWNSGVHEGKHDIGVIAQEVEAVIPEAVGEGSDGIKSVAYDKLVPLLIESVKEQQAMIEELKQEIQNLKNK